MRLENRRYKNLAELAVVYHKMSKSLVTEYEDGKRKKIKKKEMVTFIFLLLQSFLWVIQMHFVCLHCQDAKPNGSDDTAEEVWLKKMNSKSATNEIWKIHATGNTAFDIWQTQAVNDCVLNKN